MPSTTSASGPVSDHSAEKPFPALDAQFAFTVRASVAPPVSVGEGPVGERRFIAITGGTVAGPLMNGRVLPGSGDWQVVRADGVLSAQARYTLESSDGVLIAVTNNGLRHAEPEIMAKLMRGEPVPRGSYYFRTAAQFEAPVNSAYAWMNRSIFVGVAEREPDAAIIHFFRVL
jgi:hypothetical protein